MSEIHNLQGVISSIPRAPKATEAAQNLMANTNESLAETNRLERQEALKQVKELDQASATEKEDEEKRKFKENAVHSLGKQEYHQGNRRKQKQKKKSGPQGEGGTNLDLYG